MSQQQATIDVTGVSVEFPRGRRRPPFRALDSVDLAVRPGQVSCLLGPNGSGKTTLMNILTGLLTPTSGRLRVLGLDPTAQRRELLRRIALVPQETSLYPELTARENLAFHASYYGMPARAQRARIDETLELVQLGSRARDRAGTFSGGMQRRLALGKALMMKPEVLLLDEPTLGVDVQSREAIWTRIDEVAQEGRIVLLTTNYMEEAQRLGDQITIIDRGMNVVGGSLSELTSQVPDVERVEVPAVSLQDVFLHFTGRGLRN
ncbi:ABC transporter ATP-binding protein [Ruania halotolerans]|uniref:ABC transporter ATP-binding protein n=1 Tax=Ruania halotolerans TaxID=2897773 RepID=UPI001E5E29B8|nr:ABC transporter ATP-binding protein [Ruania halotolerans]UFU04881.1 ABC transporter ATP-binding protein [Ruania halotolerans]